MQRRQSFQQQQQHQQHLAVRCARVVRVVTGIGDREPKLVIFLRLYRAYTETK